MDPGADEQPDRKELANRVDELEQTVSKMLPDRRGVLKGLGAAAVGGAAVGASSGGASGQSAAGQIGTPDDRVDVFANNYDVAGETVFDSVSTDSIQTVADIVIKPSDDIYQAPTDASSSDTISISGTHTVDEPLTFSGVDDLTLDLSGATIRRDDTGTARDATVSIDDCQNATVIGGEIDSDKANNIDKGTNGVQSALNLGTGGNPTSAVIIGTTCKNAFDGCILGGKGETTLIDVTLENSDERGVYVNDDITMLGGSIKGTTNSSVKLKSPDCRGQFFSVEIDANGSYICSAEGGVQGARFADCFATNVLRAYVTGTLGPSGEQNRELVWSGGTVEGSDPGQIWLDSDGSHDKQTAKILNATIQDFEINKHVGVVRDSVISSSVTPVITPTRGTTVNGCDISTTGTAEIISPESGGPTGKEKVITECVIDGENAAKQALFDTTSDGNVRFSDNTIIAITDFGVYFQNSGANIRVTNNRIDNGNAIGGVRINSGYDDIIVTNNNLSDTTGITDNSGTVNKVINNNLT